MSEKRTRMTLRQWRELPEEDREVLKALNILDLVKPLPSKTSPTSPQPRPKPYVLVITSTCSICETIFEKYFRMLPSKESPYILQAKEVAFKDLLPTDTVRKGKEPCSGCFHCYKVLGKESKEELIKRIIALTGGNKL